MPKVVIVGAGMSGICMGVKLRRAGFDDFTILEKAESVGGTWRENTYPGLSCDVPSSYYAYTFDPNAEWTHYFSSGAEIREYFERATRRHGLEPHIRFGEEVTEARFEDGRWLVATNSGRDKLEADVLVSAAGVLHHPRTPQIEGLDDFGGAMFHSARWDHSVALAGKRVGVVGTGSTGVQIVTAVAGVASHLSMFQRTPQWILPIPNPSHGGAFKRLMRRPGFARLNYALNAGIFNLLTTSTIKPGWQRKLIDRACRWNLTRVKDPGLCRKLTPDYVPMCKRLVVSSGFYDAVQRPDVEIVDTAIARIEPGGIRTADGRLHELDVLVLATGFDAHAYLRPINLVGLGGRTLDGAWQGEPRAYKTVCLPGFPNFFMIMGPNSPIGNTSLVPVAETQADYALQWIQKIASGEVAWAAPKSEAMERFNTELRDAMPGTVWTTGCDSWYLGQDGVPMLWPWSPGRFKQTLSEPRLDEFEIH